MDINLNQAPDSPPVSKREILVILLIILTGFGLRFAYPNRVAIEHFDEGVYASNVWFGDTKEKTYPEQHLYAPPFLATVIECLFLTSGPSNWLAILPGQISGALTPLVLWWIGRSWFGPVAGQVAAILCAFCEAEILLSRSALTDVPLGLWWLLAIWTLNLACRSGRVTNSILAGGFVSLAWWTKYNGWMPLGISLAAVIVHGFVRLRARDPRAWSILIRGFRTWLISAVTAAAIWSPWIWSLQSRGGYRAVLANHSLYVVGLSGWWPSFWRQIAQLNGVAGRLGTLSLLASVWLTISLAARRVPQSAQSENDGSATSSVTNARDSRVSESARNLTWQQVAAVCSALLFGCVISVWPVIAVFGLALLGLILRANFPEFGSVGQSDNRISSQEFWILAVWLLGMLAATPLYHPYLRLTVPLLLASFLGAGLCLQDIVDRRLLNFIQPADQASDPQFRLRPELHRGRRWSLASILFSICFLGALSTVPRNLNSMSCYSDRTGLVGVAHEIKTAIESPSRLADGESTNPVIYVFAEPALLFQLRLAGVDVVTPAGSLSFANSRWGNSGAQIYLAIGIHAESDPTFKEQFSKLKSRLKSVGSWPWHLSPLVSLDQPNSQPSRLGSDPTESATIELFQVIAE